MKRSCKLCWGISALLAIALGVGAYTFLIRGSVSYDDDGRTAILVSAGERDHILGEMRGLLEAVQEITSAVADDDMQSVISSARAVGMTMAGGEDPALVAKLPLEFKKNGFAAHSAFDDLAQNAENSGDLNLVIKDLSEILGACTSCHAGYRIGIEEQ